MDIWTAAIFLRCALCTVHCYNLPWISAGPGCEVACCLPHLSIAAFQTGLMTLLVASLAFVLLYTEEGRVR